MFKGKNVLVAGGSGLIGRQLVDLLLEEEANVLIADLRKSDNENIEQMSLDLTVYNNCLKACSGMDYVFNLLCAKGSPKAMKERPASHFAPMILFDTNLIRAAKDSNVKRYMYSSTLGVYAPAEVFFEDDVWKTFPSKNDRFAGWAKRMGELQTEAYQIQYGWDEISIVRPANTYGPYDDFDSDGAMVVPSLVKKVLSANEEIVAWGDGSNIRDFVHSKDVARGMITVMKSCPGPLRPINLGSGTGYSIKELINTIIEHSGKNPKIVWDTTKPSGDKIRVLDTSRAQQLGIHPRISLEEGIKDLVGWYKENG
jgi:GDP-L-fucose synthase